MTLTAPKTLFSEIENEVGTKRSEVVPYYSDKENIIESTEHNLSFLNNTHSFALTKPFNTPSAASKSVLKQFWCKLIRKLLAPVLSDYFLNEHEFQAHLVRYLNSLDLSLNSLKETVEKRSLEDLKPILDYIDEIHFELAKLNAAADKHEINGKETSLELIGSKFESISAKLLSLETRVKTLESVSTGLEQIIAQSSKNPKNQVSGEEQYRSSSPVEQNLVNYNYLLLENRYRGSEGSVSERLRIYLPYFNNQKNPILEIGPGRGEFLSLCKDSGIPAYGFDLDAAMVEKCISKNLDVKLGDGIAHLESLPNNSLGGIIATQVVEHLPLKSLQYLLDLAKDKLNPGGKIILETIYSESIVALTKNYFRDPTHVAPLHPDTLSYLLTLSGLNIKELKHLSPYPKEATLEDIPGGEYLTPRFRLIIQALNRNVERLNNLLFGFQDYCIIAEKN